MPDMSTATEKQFDLIYDGWAPCVHHESDKEKFAAWLADVTRDVQPYTDAHEGGLLESFLWLLNGMDAAPTLVSDMWTACICEGTIAGKTVRTRIQGDTFLLSVGESYRWWRDKTAELSGA